MQQSSDLSTGYPQVKHDLSASAQYPELKVKVWAPDLEKKFHELNATYGKCLAKWPVDFLKLRSIGAKMSNLQITLMTDYNYDYSDLKRLERTKPWIRSAGE